MDSKKNSRASIKAFLNTVDTAYFKTCGSLAADKLVREDFWQNAERVLLFISMKREIDTSLLLSYAFEQKKKVYIPRIEGEEIEFYRILDKDFPSTQNAYGCIEPLSGQKLEQGGDTVLIVTPGLAFDLRGNRLGRGKGYYDRFFARLYSPCFKVGFCLAEQVVKELPVDDLDWPVNALVTSEGFRKTEVLEKPQLVEDRKSVV